MSKWRVFYSPLFLENMKNIKIISGGQTGADLAGLWVAKLFGLQTGGMAPKGWKTLIGSMPQLETLFQMGESASGYHGRTLENCEMSDITLIFASNIKSPGTKLTLHHCVKNKIHYQIFAFGDDAVTASDQALGRLVTVLQNQLAVNEDSIINIAGNSTSTSSQTFKFTFLLLCKAFEQVLRFKPEQLKNHGIDKVEAMARDRYDQSTFDFLTKV